MILRKKQSTGLEGGVKDTGVQIDYQEEEGEEEAEAEGEEGDAEVANDDIAENEDLINELFDDEANANTFQGEQDD